MGTRAIGIFGSLPILAAAFGRREGVKVEIGGDTAYTDGHTIHLPALPLDCDEHLAVKAFGFLYHEAGHIEFTDLSVFSEAQRDGHLLRCVLNMIEDVRMENMRNSIYPGSAESLRNLVGVLTKEGIFGTTETIEVATSPQVIASAMLTYLRSSYLGQPCAEVADLWMGKAESLLGTAGMVKFKALLSPGQLDALDTTADALALARRVITLIEDVAQETQPSSNELGSKEDNEETGSDGQNGAAQGNSGHSSNDATSATGQDVGEEPVNGINGSSGDAGLDVERLNPSSISRDVKKPDTKALQEALSAGEDDISPTDLGDIAAKALEQKASEAVAADQLINRGSKPVDKPLTVSRSTANGPGELHKVLASSQQLRTKLVAAMDAEARVKLTYRREGSRLDGRVVHRLFTGDSRVFVRKEHTRKVNTAVQILLDRSSSMNNGMLEVARKAALASAVGIGQIHGCKVAAAAFPSIEVLKDFEESSRGAAGRFLIEPNGNTPMDKAMIWAAGQLAVRLEDRKMLIIVTDGEPDDPGMVARLVPKFQAAGVEVIGIGIRTQSVKRLFKSSVVIQTVDELANALFSVVSNKLRRVA